MWIGGKSGFNVLSGLGEFKKKKKKREIIHIKDKYMRLF